MEKHDLVVVKADKGNTVVILKRTEYVNKMLNILSDETKFKEVDHEATLVRLRKYQSFLRYHHKRGVFTDEEYGELFPTSTSIPTMYGLPKTHKDGIPLRPILSMVGCFNTRARQMDQQEAGAFEGGQFHCKRLIFLRLPQRP